MSRPKTFAEKLAERRKVLTKVCVACEKEHPATLVDESGSCTYCRAGTNGEEAKEKAAESKEQAKADRLREEKAKRLEMYRQKQAAEKELAARRAKEAESQEVFDAQEAARAELARRQLAKDHLLPMVMRANPDYLPGWVHKDICEHLEWFSDAVAAGQSPRLIINMPPRSGKSELASRIFPAWHLGRNPKHEVIACSYAGSLANDFSRKVRGLLREAAFQSVFPECQLSKDSQSVEVWNTNQGGGYVAAGVGGPITGRGAHVLIIDDPLKNREDAESESTRQSIWDWYTSTAYTRLAPGGGVIVMMCMTGDTPVLMADGTEKRLDTVAPGDEVATYRNGALSTSTVEASRSSGRDQIYKITMKSGRMVRANERHPFLADDGGGLKWIRLRALTSGHTIAVNAASAGSGKAKLAPLAAATNQPSAAGCAALTTTSGNGLLATDHQAQALSHAAKRVSSTATALPLMSTTGSLPNREAFAPSAQLRPEREDAARITGSSICASTTAMTLAKSEGCFATSAISPQDTLPMSEWHVPCSNTSDFMLEEIASIEPDGVEEVFDLQIAETENFIANGLVSHNTRWHDDDLGGRLLQKMEDDEGDEWKVVRYPAIAEHDELFRKAGEALHPERYPLEALERTKRTVGPRDWSALYQQNPVADDGDYFKKEDFQWFNQKDLPPLEEMNFYTAWDLAIGQKEMNDFTVGITVGVDRKDDIYVVDVQRGRWGSLEIIEKMIEMQRVWKAKLVGIERGHILMTMGPILEKRMREERMMMPIEELRPGKQDKIARARPIQARMQQRRVYFRRHCDRTMALVAEMMRFPNGKHDDQVDTMAWVGQMLTLYTSTREKKQPPKASWRDKLSKTIRSANKRTAMTS